jgi:hypothetical protein
VGRKNTPAEQQDNIEWAKQYCGNKETPADLTALRDIRAHFAGDLRRYFALAALSRSTTAPAVTVDAAMSMVFRVRVLLERSIEDVALRLVARLGMPAINLRDEPLHGSSNKQGVSIRMPLSSCAPSKVCGAACYAHDVLDAAPASVVRGALNGAIATWFEEGDKWHRAELLAALERPVQRMVRSAQKDAEAASVAFVRRPRIRFAHVGEFAPFPAFANALARRVRELSDGGVDCVVYTRHPDARLLDPELFVVLFSLDESSENRRRFAPPTALVVRSAFGGRVSESVDVNFLEHHRWTHIHPVGSGKVCPATAPETRVRTCDACKCDLCFTPKRPARRSESSAHALAARDPVTGGLAE